MTESSRTGRALRELTFGVPARSRWFSSREFKEVIAPRARDLIREGRFSEAEVKAALVTMLVPLASGEVQHRVSRTPLRDHTVEYEEILIGRVWQAVESWDCDRVDGLCSLLGAQTVFAGLDTGRAGSEASRRTRLYGGRFQAMEDQVVQSLGRQLSRAEQRDLARDVLPGNARDERVDEIVNPLKVVLKAEIASSSGQTREGSTVSPEDEFFGRWVSHKVRDWLETMVPRSASSLYRRWLARPRSDVNEPPPYIVRPLLPYVPELLAALGDDALNIAGRSPPEGEVPQGEEGQGEVGKGEVIPLPHRATAPSHPAPGRVAKGAECRCVTSR